MKGEGFSLQAKAKTLEGAQHPDRDAQFRYLNERVKDHQADGEPVISGDIKKRERLGRLPMAGREWRPRGQPVKVEDHHFFFTGPDVEQAIPYGIYDLTRNTGWVNVGVDHDTAVFAGRVGDASRPPGRTLSSSRPCWRWWSRTNAAIRCRRCGGRPSRCGMWPGSSPGRAIRSRPRRWADC